MKLFASFFAFVCISLTTLVAQESTSYEIEGAKLGRKMGRQITQSSIERTVAVNNIENLSIMENNKGNRRFTSFVGAMDGAVIASLAKRYSYQYVYQGENKINYRNRGEYSTDISGLEITNVTYADENLDGSLDKDETAQVYFDLLNTSSEPLYGIMPVLMANKTKHIMISEPCPIDTLKNDHAVRYVIEIAGDGKKNPGKTSLVLRIKYGKNQYQDVRHIVLGTKRRSDSE